MKKKTKLKPEIKSALGYLGLVLIACLIAVCIVIFIICRVNTIQNDSRFQKENYYEISQKKTEMLRTNQSNK